MQKGEILDLNTSLATTASRLGLEHHLPMTDSIILATVQTFDAIIWMQDADFQKISTVRYFPKR